MLTIILLAAQLSAFDQVVAAERAFAAASLSKGQHEAFLENLADDAITFNPTPQPARKLHEEGPSQGKLSWGPAWVAVSAAGDLALSSGPWQFRPPDDAPMKVTSGYFISVWRRQAGGAWKVAVDAGTSFPMGLLIPKTVENASAKTAKPGTAAEALEAITTAERAFMAKAKTGVGAAVAGESEPSVRVYREGRAAGIGGADAQRLLTADKRTGACSLERVVPATSGDMGYAYGTCDYGSREIAKKGFLHVWRKQADGAWKILVDVTP